MGINQLTDVSVKEHGLRKLKIGSEQNPNAMPEVLQQIVRLLAQISQTRGEVGEAGASRRNGQRNNRNRERINDQSDNPITTTLRKILQTLLNIVMD